MHSHSSYRSIANHLLKCKDLCYLHPFIYCMLGRREEKTVIPFQPSSYSPPANRHLHQPIIRKSKPAFNVLRCIHIATDTHKCSPTLYLNTKTHLYDSQCRFEVWVGFSDSFELLSALLNNVTVNEMDTDCTFNH